MSSSAAWGGSTSGAESRAEVFVAAGFVAAGLGEEGFAAVGFAAVGLPLARSTMSARVKESRWERMYTLTSDHTESRTH
ncbi:MAG: hypothetical protein ACRDX8_11560, partial [Acidimicrobiales bacterium]